MVTRDGAYVMVFIHTTQSIWGRRRPDVGTARRLSDGDTYPVSPISTAERGRAMASGMREIQVDQVLASRRWQGAPVSNNTNGRAAHFVPRHDLKNHHARGLNNHPNPRSQ